MTDPLPESEKGTAYNLSPRPRQKKWFRPFTEPQTPEGFYTPFWPLLIIFFAFMVLLVYQISFLRSRAMSLHTQLVRLSEGVQKANEQTTFIEGLHADIEALAPAHPAAALLLKEFFLPPTTSASPTEPEDQSKTPAAPTPPPK